jgi:hypothetical protein
MKLKRRLGRKAQMRAAKALAEAGARVRLAKDVDLGKADPACPRCQGQGVTGAQEAGKLKIPIVCRCVRERGGVKADGWDRISAKLAAQVRSNGANVAPKGKDEKEESTVKSTEASPATSGLNSGITPGASAEQPGGTSGTSGIVQGVTSLQEPNKGPGGPWKPSGPSQEAKPGATP